MSYCRLSSNDFGCDIYAFEDIAGIFEVIVASIRYQSPDPKPIPGHFSSEGYRERYEALAGWIVRADRVPIGLPFDGKQYSFKTAKEAADKMEELRAAGYNVPQYAIDAVREESVPDAEEDEP